MVIYNMLRKLKYLKVQLHVVLCVAGHAYTGQVLHYSVMSSREKTKIIPLQSNKF